jgi:phosphate transport system protein
MTVHFHREMESVKSQILRLGTIVEEQLYFAIKAVEELDQGLAETVISQDDRVDQMEVEIEEECLKVMALYQPVAIDLRLIVAVMKISPKRLLTLKPIKSTIAKNLIYAIWPIRCVTYSREA